MLKRLLCLAYLTLGLTNGAFAMEPKTERAIFAGGCFWCMEAEFEGTKGVIAVTSGYTGGTVKDPTYEQVGSGTTGHAEAIEVVYDPAQVSYEQLLAIYWGNIDPTDAGGQFYDRGTQYRTAIFYTTEAQKKAAEASLARQKEKLKVNLATQIVPASAFYKAEEYHQDYAKKNPLRYNAYKMGSGRTQKLKDVWKDDTGK